MRLLKRIVAASLAILSLGAQSSQAAFFSYPQALKAHVQRVTFNAPVMAPFAYTHFCLRYADDCRIHGRQFHRPRPFALTKARWTDLVLVNKQVNVSITPHAYRNDNSYDTWRIGPQAGDCNDFAVTKRHELLARGWPSRALLLAEVVTTWGEHHLVLLVHTATQDYVLDNLNANIKLWSKTPYSWVRMQSPSDAVLWTSISDARHSPIAS